MKKNRLAYFFTVILILTFSLPGLACYSMPASSLSGSDLIVSDEQEIAPPFNAHYLRGVYSSVPANRNIVVISSTRELEQYYHVNRRKTGNLNLIWNESFFVENFLVLVNLTESSGSIRHEVERIDPNGNIVIRRIIPQIGTADMARWNIFIEINNKNRAENYKIEIINDRS